MNKPKNKKYIKLASVIGLSFAFGLTACQSNYNDNINNNAIVENQEIKKRQNVTYDDSTYTITYDSEDLISNNENYILWNNIFNVLSNNGYSSTNKLNIVGTLRTPNSTFGITTIFPRNDIANIPNVEGLCNAVDFSINGPGATIILIDDNNTIRFSASPSNTDNYSISITSETYYNLFAPQEEATDDLGQVATDFFSILTGGIVRLGEGIATGVASMARALFLNIENGEVTGLSVFGGIVAIFAGLALAIAITTRVYTWITSLGN